MKGWSKSADVDFYKGEKGIEQSESREDAGGGVPTKRSIVQTKRTASVRPTNNKTKPGNSLGKSPPAMTAAATV
eukprot:CAMPEP_0201133116 /NCGR_PEP_ID=MMETSP0850-20130426/47979_1 /ASSEMBLY_ACC=CAM_ASM_000622 /TAXON_ID=183588 /ORGANISM="Pseudo-nitzschia fraudulenta, Strain WWA7" /LENGTH=73 /DNA_ID=CAMNT_0047403671 /DNA_START=39 /DNA_END=260 /DNA_ORIENTATION=+